MYKGLYDIFKHWYKGGRIFLYSDPHFADEEMKRLRKNYISDEEQIKRINKLVGKNDTIIFLGDIGDVECVKKIRGYKVLIMGNHDKGASNYKRVVTVSNVPEWSYADNRLFDEVYEGILTISDKIILSHEPIENLPEFLFNIHGHDHSGSFLGKNYLNVCAENIDYTPVALNDILFSGKLKDIESIHRATIDKAIDRKAKRNK